MSDKLLEVKNLRTYFHTDDGIVKSVDDVSFEVKRGKTLGVVGESGCGKSITSLSIMQLVEIPPGKIEGGEIIYEGQNLLEKSKDEMRKIRGGEIAMIFQEPMTSLNPVKRIGWQVEEPLRLHTEMTKEERYKKVLQMLEDVELENPERIYNQYPHELSGGMRQRVMIAAAMICNPKILIADEPTTALDVTIQAQIVELLKKLNKEKKTSVIFISHDLSLVRQLCERVMVMQGGYVVETGNTEDIFNHPKEEYTKKLISAIPKVVKKR